MKSNPGARQPPTFLVVGRIVRPHGVRGALVLDTASSLVQSITSSSKVYIGEERLEAVVRSIRPHRGRYLLQIEGCHDRDMADLWRGKEVFIRFEQALPLEEGEYYYWQILGMRVVTDVGEDLGTIQDILATGANDVYIIRNEQGEELLLPAIQTVILEVNLDQELMTVRLLPGLRP